MLNNYDKILKNYVSSFLKVGKSSIRLIGIQNEDNQEDLAFSQEGSAKDTLKFPIVGMVRLPSINITDDAQTKRAATYEGFLVSDSESKAKVTLNCMRCDLSYVFDIYAENRKTAEDIGIQLYFKLRTHPNFDVSIALPIKDAQGNQVIAECTPNIVLDPQLSHLHSQSLENSQLYKFRIKLMLQNVNIYDYEVEDEILDVQYEIVAKLQTEIEYNKI